MQIRAALRTGVSPNDLAEVFLHTAVYGSVPNSNRAFELGKNALEDAVGSTSMTRHDGTHAHRAVFGPRPCSFAPSTPNIRVKR